MTPYYFFLPEQVNDATSRPPGTEIKELLRYNIKINDVNTCIWSVFTPLTRSKTSKQMKLQNRNKAKEKKCRKIIS